MLGFAIFLCVLCDIIAEGIFRKPLGFGTDASHDRYFRKIDLDRDGFISKQEFTLSLNVSETVFDYLTARASLDTISRNISGLSYSEFMWFYRESDLFEKSPIPCVPEQLYSFPAWPGMQSVPVPEEDGLSSSKFWSSYVGPHKAVVLRNGLAGSPALNNWKDASYLKRNFGDLSAKIEVKKEARGDRSVSKPVSTRATIAEILDGSVDGYVVSVVPQPMAWEVVVPSAVLCGDREGKPYLDLRGSVLGQDLTQLEETSLWISRGTTRSQLHYDKENTMNCLVTGSPKKWVILDTRKYGHSVPWVRGGGYNQKNDLNTLYTDWVGVNVDFLDLNLHQYLLDFEFETVTQYPGDCVFLPYSMLHYAEHFGEDVLQVAVSYMWLPEVQFNPACLETSRTIPLAVFDHVWYFGGNGVVPQGLYDPRILEKAFLMEIEGRVRFSVERIFEFLPTEFSKNDQGLEEVVRVVNLITRMLDRGLAIPQDVWLQLSSAVDLNAIECNTNEVYIPREMEEMDRMISFLLDM